MADVMMITLAIFGAVLFAIVYALRVLVIMERRLERMEKHIEGLSKAILTEEKNIETKVGRKKKK